MSNLCVPHVNPLKYPSTSLFDIFWFDRLETSTNRAEISKETERRILLALYMQLYPFNNANFYEDIDAHY